MVHFWYYLYQIIIILELLFIIYIIILQIEEVIIGEVGVFIVKKNSNNSSKYTEDWVPIKNIRNGMIQLENNYYVTGIRVEPKNIFILDYQTQNNIIFNLRNFYNVIDYEFWLVVCDRPVDINMYLAQLQLMYANVNNQQIRKIISQDIDKGEMFRSTTVNAVDTEYYILFRDKK